MFSRDGTSPRNWVGCRTSRLCMGRPTTTRATPLAANLPALGTHFKDANA